MKKLLQNCCDVLRLSHFWGLWTCLGGWVPLALQRAQVIAPVELWSEQGDSGSIFLFKFGQTWSFAWNAPSWIFDTPDWRCFVVTFFGINKMLTDGISRGRSWKRRVQCFLFLEKSISSQFRLFANVECFLFLGKWISSQFRWFANVQPQQSKDLHKDAQKKKVPLTRWGGGGLGGGPAEYPGVHLKEAILIPIVLPAFVALQCCTVGIHMYVHASTLSPISLPLLWLSSTWPPPTPWGETTHGRPSTELVTIHICDNLLATFGCQYIATNLGETCLPSLPSLESLPIITRVGDGAYFGFLVILIWSN